MKYPSPDQSAAVKVINTAGSFSRRVGLRGSRLDSEKLVAKARKRTGLTDFGDPSYRASLDRLVEALEREARLSTIGRFGTRESLVHYLSQRLRLVDYRKRHPQVAEQKIQRPLFILGLPRTGTTIFYELLAQDPAYRCPLGWEVDEPVPPARLETYDSDPRIERVEKRFGQLEMLAPGFKSMHEIGATLPQECVAIWASQFWGDVFGASYHIPSYRSWTLENGATDAYAWHNQFLQHMQSEYALERWVLKTPPHLAYLTELVSQYPDAAIVWTHREPMSVLGSLSSLACTLHSAMSDHIDPLVTGQHESEYFAALLNKGMKQREGMVDGDRRFFDVAFRDIISDPVAIIEQLYAHFGFEFSEELRNRMQRYLDNRPRHKHGKHSYKLEDYGLSKEKQRPLFKEYCERYGYFLPS